MTLILMLLSTAYRNPFSIDRYSVWQKMVNAESYLNEVVKNCKFLAVPLIDTYF